MADEQKATKNPNEKMGVFKNSLPSHAPVSTCWAEEVSDFQHPPNITIINAINTIWLCEEDPSHRIIMTPTFRLTKAILREEEFWKGIRLQEEPREEAPPKEEEIRLEFLEIFQEGGKWKKKKKKKRSRQVFFRLIANSWAKPPSALRLVSPSSSLYWIPLAPVLSSVDKGNLWMLLWRFG